MLYALAQRTNAVVLTAACVVAIALVGVSDAVTGTETSFSAFYLLPVLVAAIRSRRAGAPMAALATLAWVISDAVSRSTPYPAIGVPLWNATVRGLVFVVVVVLVGALHRSAAHERMLARRDPLTGLANRRAFYEAAAEEVSRARRHNHPLTVAYIDIDDFKLVNDSLGHATGDEVLAATAAELTASLRDLDVAGRLGGDEFALLLANTDIDQANVVLQRLHGRLNAFAAENGWPVGFSLGAVTYTRPAASVDDIVHGADSVMYAVKSAGKNSVRIVGDTLRIAA